MTGAPARCFACPVRPPPMAPKQKPAAKVLAGETSSEDNPDVSELAWQRCSTVCSECACANSDSLRPLYQATLRRETRATAPGGAEEAGYALVPELTKVDKPAKPTPPAPARVIGVVLLERGGAVAGARHAWLLPASSHSHLGAGLERVELPAELSRQLCVAFSPPPETPLSIQLKCLSPLTFARTVLRVSGQLKNMASAVQRGTGNLQPPFTLRSGKVIVGIDLDCILVNESKAQNGGSGGTVIVAGPALTEAQLADEEVDHLTATATQVMDIFEPKNTTARSFTPAFCAPIPLPNVNTCA